MGYFKNLLCIVVISACIFYQQTLAADPNDITNKHNVYRLKVAKGQVPNQPRGINLKRFQWDNYLAQKAQEIADRCYVAHVKVDDKRFGVGQNLYASSGPRNENWGNAVDSWYNEYKVYNYNDQYQSAAGHYTQIIWANTQYVGCAYTYCPDVQWTNMYVCNYGPAGNVIGQYPYQTGNSGCENLC